MESNTDFFRSPFVFSFLTTLQEKQKNLLELTLYRCELNLYGFQSLEKAVAEGGLPLLQGFRLGTCPLPFGMNHLGTFEFVLKSPTLKVFHLVDMDLSASTVGGFAMELAQNTVLKKLILAENKLTDFHTNLLCSALTQNSTLTHLMLGHNLFIDPSPLFHLLEKNSSLKILDLKNNQLNKEKMKLKENQVVQNIV
jgi:Ran GTPase-activating protein (RanGAP) involved in mRNA processing and transport